MDNRIGQITEETLFGENGLIDLNRHAGQRSPYFCPHCGLEVSWPMFMPEKLLSIQSCFNIKCRKDFIAFAGRLVPVDRELIKAADGSEHIARRLTESIKPLLENLAAFAGFTPEQKADFFTKAQEIVRQLVGKKETHVQFWEDLDKTEKAVAERHAFGDNLEMRRLLAILNRIKDKMKESGSYNPETENQWRQFFKKLEGVKTVDDLLKDF